MNGSSKADRWRSTRFCVRPNAVEHPIRRSSISRRTTVTSSKLTERQTATFSAKEDGGGPPHHQNEDQYYPLRDLGHHKSVQQSRKILGRLVGHQAHIYRAHQQDHRKT